MEYFQKEENNQNLDHLLSHLRLKEEEVAGAQIFAGMKGDTVVFGFRAQAFVTRAFVVPVSGISKGKPKVEGIFDSDGKVMGWPNC